MGMKTLVGAWLCTLAFTVMAGVAITKQPEDVPQSHLTDGQKSICSVLEVQSFCE